MKPVIKYAIFFLIVDFAFFSCKKETPPTCVFTNAQLVPFGTLSQPGYIDVVATAGNKILFQGGGTRIDIYDITTNKWATAELTLERWNMSVSSIGNKVFFAGGEYSSTTDFGDYYSKFFSRVDIYDASADTWSIAELSQARSLMASGSTGNKILFAGGNTDISSSRVDIFDASTDSWSITFLSEARRSLSATIAGDKIYFTGGFSNAYGNQFSKRIDIYDAVANSWSTSALTCEPKSEMASIAVGNKIFWVGGKISNSSPQISDKVEIRDLNTQISTCAKLCNSAFAMDRDAVLKDNKIIFYNRFKKAENPFEIYDVSADKWSVLRLDKQIRGAGIISVNNKIYVAGGLVNGVLSNQVWLLEF